MDLEGIRLLIRVVEFGSVQRAANQIGMSRSSLRRKLENLEAEVGSELFVRSAAGITLTPAGAIVVSEGRGLLERFARMVSSAKSTEGSVAGKFLVVVPVGMPDSIRIGMMRLLHALAPSLRIDEVERLEPLEHLHEPFDLLFHFGEPPESGPWFSRVLARTRLVPLASEAYLEEHGRPSSPADLAGHRLLSWRVGRLDPRVWPLWSGGRLAVEPLGCSRNGQMLHRAAQEGVGILLGSPDPRWLTAPTPLIPVLDAEIGHELSVRWLSPLPADADPRSRLVLESIQSVLTQIALEP